MKLKTAIFYQSVKSWDNNESNTFKADSSQTIELVDHLVKITKENKKEVIIVPTANLRYAVADYHEAFDLKHGTDETLKTFPPTETQAPTKKSIIDTKKKLEKVNDVK